MLIRTQGPLAHRWKITNSATGSVHNPSSFMHQNQVTEGPRTVRNLPTCLEPPSSISRSQCPKTSTRPLVSLPKNKALTPRLQQV